MINFVDGRPLNEAFMLSLKYSMGLGTNVIRDPFRETLFLAISLVSTTLFIMCLLSAIKMVMDPFVPPELHVCDINQTEIGVE
ncbi:hypothetical protein WR25_17848 [Diploscapter pachys]|uniref:Uncharacterized protein n=1 Tax=Diploscapter pachys TaxID=2018661 RepID=A0A2A2JME4_9BILA|nr:hypothetical protein WR25_17848 [Diploscapter pachys]